MTKTDAKWLERIRQWKESGKSAEEFAEGQPFKATTLKWRDAEQRRAARGGARYGKAAADVGAIRFARVVPVPRPSATPAAPIAGLTLEVAGARISLSRGFDAELLVEVVRALGTSR
jgi:hypothetical protein